MQYLTVFPPVYHDNYVILAPSVSLTEGEHLPTGLFDSTPALTAALGGEGSHVISMRASFFYALAGWFKIFGVGIAQARFFVYFMSLVSVVLVFFIGSMWFNAWVGFAAAIALTLDSNVWYSAREVRPESFTLACYLASALILSIRSEKWRWDLAPVAGAFFGLGVAGHPVGFVSAPIVLCVPFFVFQGMPDRRYLFRFLLPALLIATIYVGFIAIHWQEVLLEINLNSAQRAYKPLTFLERIDKEWDRYWSTYWNYYNLYFRTIGCYVRVLAWCGWLLLLLSGIIRLFKKQKMVLSSWLFVLSVPCVVVMLSFLGRDNNFLYLFNFYPWLYLSGAAGIYMVGQQLIDKQREAVVIAGVAFSFLFIGIWGVCGTYIYVSEAAVYRDNSVMSYSTIEDLLASEIKNGSFVIGAPTSWLAARRAGAEFIFSKQYLQKIPNYLKYPVRSEFTEASHLAAYDFDYNVLREISDVGKNIYFVYDTWDWAWNLYAPFGRFAATSMRVIDQLRMWFKPVLTIYSKDRGFVRLYIFDENKLEEGDEEIIYLEGQPYRVLAELRPEGNVLHGSFPLKSSQQLEVARYKTNPGRYYWLHMETAKLSGEHYVNVLWNGRYMGRAVDSLTTIPIDIIAKTDSSLSLIAIVKQGDGECLLAKVSFKELILDGEVP
jgi:hypothetical protein